MKKYQTIINDIILKIETGIFKEGEKLYTEREIKSIYNVSSTTAVRVLNELETNGHIFRVQGKGSFVSKTLVNKKLFLTEKNNFKHYFPDNFSEHNKVISVEVIEDKDLCHTLKIFPQKLVKISRVKYVNSVAWAYQVNYIPLKHLPNLNFDDVESFSELATMLRNKYRIDIHKEKFKKKMKVSLEVPNYAAEYITENNEPCFEFDRYTYFSDGKLFEYVKIYINYKYYQVTIRNV